MLLMEEIDGLQLSQVLVRYLSAYVIAVEIHDSAQMLH